MLGAGTLGGRALEASRIERNANSRLVPRINDPVATCPVVIAACHALSALGTYCAAKSKFVIHTGKPYFVTQVPPPRPSCTSTSASQSDRWPHQPPLAAAGVQRPDRQQHDVHHERRGHGQMKEQRQAKIARPGPGGQVSQLRTEHELNQCQKCRD